MFPSILGKRQISPLFPYEVNVMKLIVWLTKLTVGTALIALLSTATTCYVLTRYVDDVLKQYGIQTAGTKNYFIDILTTMTHPTAQDKQNKTTASVPEAKPGPSPNPSPNPATKDDAIAAWSQSNTQSGSQSNAEQQNAMAFSAEELAQKKNKLSDTDKTRLFTLLMTKVPQDGMQRISQLMENGITTDEMTEIENILKTYLSEADMKELRTMLSKY
jgi:hypothetical protein